MSLDLGGDLALAGRREARSARRRGVAVGARGLVIAATSLAEGFAVVTRDRRSFSKIPDLDVEAW